MYKKELTEYMFNDEVENVKLSGYVVIDNNNGEVLHKTLYVDLDYYKEKIDDYLDIKKEIEEKILLEPDNYKEIIKKILNKYLNSYKVKLKQLYKKETNNIKNSILEKLLNLNNKEIKRLLNNVINFGFRKDSMQFFNIDGKEKVLKIFKVYKDEINEIFSDFLKKEKLCLEDLGWFDNSDFLFLKENNQINVTIFVIENIIFDIAEEINFKRN